MFFFSICSKQYKSLTTARTWAETVPHKIAECVVHDSLLDKYMYGYIATTLPNLV